MTDKTRFHNTRDQNMQDATNCNISEQMKKRIEFHPKDNVTLLLELTRESATFLCQES